MCRGPFGGPQNPSEDGPMADTKTYQTGESQPPARASAVLRILYGLERGKRFELIGTEFTIGRGDNTDIVLADPTIAEVHAILYLLPTGARLRDAGSAAGLRVNGRIVDDEISLHDGAQIEIGGVVLAFSYSPPEARPEAPAEAEAAEPPAPPPLPPGPPRANPDEPAWAERDAAGSGAGPASEASEPTFTAAEGGGPSVRIDTGEKRVRQIGLRGRGTRRIRIGAQRPLVTQLVSWFVILTVLLSAIWVTRTILYDSIRIPVISAPAVAASAEDGAFQKQTGSSRTRETDAERRPAIDYGMSHVATPVEAPDQARTIFDSAMRA